MQQTDSKEAVRSEAEASGHEEQARPPEQATTFRERWWTKEMRYNYAFFFTIASYLLLADVLSNTYRTGTLNHQSTPLIAATLFGIGLMTFALDRTLVPLLGWAFGIFIFLILDSKMSVLSSTYRAQVFVLLMAPLWLAYMLFKLLGLRRT